MQSTGDKIISIAQSDCIRLLEVELRLFSSGFYSLQRAENGNGFEIMNIINLMRKGMYFILLLSNILFEFSYHGYELKKYERHTIKVCISYPRFYCVYSNKSNANLTLLCQKVLAPG